MSKGTSGKRSNGKGKGAAAANAVDGTDALPPTRINELVARFGGWSRLPLLLAVACALFIFVNVIFYSSFFTNAKGVPDSLRAFDVWTKTGQSGFHGYTIYKYFEWLGNEESPILLLAVVGAFIALWRVRQRFALFAALWGFGLLAAYSLITYKTPWLALSMLLPFALTGGYAVNELYRIRSQRIFALAALLLALGVCAYQTYELNFVHYDDDTYAYVYAHTKREYLDLINEVNRLAERAGTKDETPINVAAPEYWPMPWYLRDFKHVGYQPHVNAMTSDAVIIASVKQQAEMEATLGARYRLVATYPMRPGVTLVLFARRDLAPG